MKFNTQKAKIEAIIERTLVLGIDVGSECTIPKVLILEVSSIQGKLLNLVTQRLYSRHLHGF